MSKKVLPNVVVTGIGCISSIGLSVNECLQSLRNNRSGLGALTLFDSVHKHIPVGEIRCTHKQLIGLAKVNEHGELYSRTALLALIAAQEAADMAGVVKGEKGLGIVSATTVGGMDFNERYYKSLCVSDEYKAYADTLDCANATNKVAERFGIREHISTVSTACSSSANAIMFGARLIRNGLLKKVIVGGADALTSFTLNGFNTLEILSPTGCRPFDANRNGVSLGEGAAFLVLEEEDTESKKSALCMLSGYANTNEAYHQTASQPDGFGASLSIRKALETAGLQASDISYINAHGTGTVINDLSEANAISNIFGEHIPPFSSTKGFTGHTLAAAGALEAVISILSLQYQQLFPNIGLAEVMPELRATPISQLRESEQVRHVLSNSFGFGGSNSSLIFSHV